ncbi:MAG: hypothetical protein CMM59_01315 [Rhodospirillaceae bacterium]|nr:hypothetical protein [Rhodospirillaceae bacterium]
MHGVDPRKNICRARPDISVRIDLGLNISLFPRRRETRQRRHASLDSRFRGNDEDVTAKKLRLEFRIAPWTPRTMSGETGRLILRQAQDGAAFDETRLRDLILSLSKDEVPSAETGLKDRVLSLSKDEVTPRTAWKSAHQVPAP